MYAAETAAIGDCGFPIGDCRDEIRDTIHEIRVRGVDGAPNKPNFRGSWAENGRWREKQSQFVWQPQAQLGDGQLAFLLYSSPAAGYTLGFRVHPCVL
jgi:hypothetical protein